MPVRSKKKPNNEWQIKLAVAPLPKRGKEGEIMLVATKNGMVYLFRWTAETKSRGVWYNIWNHMFLKDYMRHKDFEIEGWCLVFKKSTAILLANGPRGGA